MEPHRNDPQNDTELAVYRQAFTAVWVEGHRKHELPTHRAIDPELLKDVEDFDDALGTYCAHEARAAVEGWRRFAFKSETFGQARITLNLEFRNADPDAIAQTFAREFTRLKER